MFQFGSLNPDLTDICAVGNFLKAVYFSRQRMRDSRLKVKLTVINNRDGHMHPKVYLDWAKEKAKIFFYVFRLILRFFRKFFDLFRFRLVWIGA